MSKSLLQVMCAFSCSSTSCGSVHFVVRTPSLYVCDGGGGGRGGAWMHGEYHDS